MNVSAIIVTRGDVDLDEIINSIPEEYELLIWDNGVPSLKIPGVCEYTLPSIKDLAVYGRYAAIEHATHDLIYVQDDDVLHKPEGIREIVNTWYEHGRYPVKRNPSWDAIDHVVCNMPANFRHSFYQEHALVGFGAAFHRDAPSRAFSRFGAMWPMVGQEDFFDRTCDIVFTALTPRILVDVLYDDMPWASADNRMWKQSTHREERGKMLDLVLKVRDAYATDTRRRKDYA